MSLWLGSSFRYIMDDLLTLNNSRFIDSKDEIYPPELELKKNTESSINCSYLDLDITIKDFKFVTDLYDKRDAFNFRIVNFPHMDSNIPSKPAYGVFISQLIRFLRVCDNYQQFANRSYNLSSKLLKQGFDFARLQNAFRKFLQRNPTVLRRYQVSHKNIVYDCVALPLCVFPSMCRHNITVR